MGFVPEKQSPARGPGCGAKFNLKLRCASASARSGICTQRRDLRAASGRPIANQSFIVTIFAFASNVSLQYRSISIPMRHEK
jgi:hypothetical protein